MNTDLKEFLSQLVAIQSISSDKSKAALSRKAADLIKTHLEQIGAQVEIIPNEFQGNNPILFGKLGDDPAKKKHSILFSL